MAVPRTVVYISDMRDELIPWLTAVAEEQRRRHPGRTVTLAGVAREALLLARTSKEIDEKLRR